MQQTQENEFWLAVMRNQLVQDLSLIVDDQKKVLSRYSEDFNRVFDNSVESKNDK